MPLIDEASKQEMIIFTNIINGRIWRNISHARIFRCFRKDNRMDNGDDIQLIVEAKAFTVDTSGSSNHNNENNNTDSIVDESSSIGTEIVRNDDVRHFFETADWCVDESSSGTEIVLREETVPDIELPAGRTWNQQLKYDLKDEDDMASISPIYNNNNGSTPRGRGRQSNRSIRSPSPMPTRARSPKPSLCRHARLANDGAPQEIWHHATGSPTIVRNNIDATDIDDIDNHNNKNKNKNNNNNNNEEEELHPRQRLYFGHM